MESNLGKHRLDPESNPLERRVDGISLFVLQGVIGLVVLVSGLLILKPSRSSFPLRTRLLKQRPGIVFFASAGLMVAIAVLLAGDWLRKPAVLVQAVPVRSGPAATFIELGSIDAGVKIRLSGVTRTEAQSGDSWTQVYFGGDQVGWIPTSALLHL